MFIELMFKQRFLGSRSGKAFTAIGRNNILMAFKERTRPHYKFQQFRNLYGQLMYSCQKWNSRIKKTGLGYVRARKLSPSTMPIGGR